MYIYDNALQASPNDADQIFKAIDWRVQQLHMKEQKRGESDGGKHPDASASSSSGSLTEKRPVTDSPEDSGPSKKVRSVLLTQLSLGKNKIAIDVVVVEMKTRYRAAWRVYMLAQAWGMYMLRL